MKSSKKKRIVAILTEGEYRRVKIFTAKAGMKMQDFMWDCVMKGLECLTERYEHEENESKRKGVVCE